MHDVQTVEEDMVCLLCWYEELEENMGGDSLRSLKQIPLMGKFNGKRE